MTFPLTNYGKNWCLMLDVKQQEIKELVRPQSINCSVRASHPPQFGIKKSEIFGVEK